MSRSQPTRRNFLRGASGVAIALPWLDFFQRGTARAQATPASTAQRFVAVFNPGGTFTYTPAANADGPVTFQYRVVDGNGAVSAVATTFTRDLE